MLMIPNSFADITAEWLTTALHCSGHLKNQKVLSRRIEPIGESAGFASRIGRITLTIDPPTSNVPRTLILKMAVPSDDAARSDLLREKYLREAQFYSIVWPHAGVRTPACYFVAHRPEPPGIVLLLEDLRAARFGDAAAGWSLEEAEQVVDALADLHATWWNDPRLSDWDWLAPVGEAAAQLEKLESRRTMFLGRYGADLSTELRELTERLGPAQRGLLARLGGPPTTLLHVDTHLDNIAFVSSNGRTDAVLFDWQGAGRGLGVFDLALFLTGGPAELRRVHEPDLLVRYSHRLTERGVSGYSLEELTDGYRLALLRWWIGTVNGLGSSYAATWTGRQAEMARQSVRNWNAIHADHQLNTLLETA